MSVAQCEACGLVFADPMPVPLQLADHYGMPPEEYWNEEYFAESDSYFSDVIADLRRLGAFRPRMPALDIGAGLGKGMIAMERAGLDAYGFEPSKSFRDRAISQMGLNPERLRLDSVESAFYEPHAFGFITFGAVLEHLRDPSESISKAMRWLSPGGLIHAEVPSSNWLIAKIANAIYTIQGTDYVANLSPMHPPFHLYEFTLASFRENGVRLGYSVAHHQYYVCQTYAPRILSLPLQWYMRRTGTGMQLSVWLRKSGG